MAVLLLGGCRSRGLLPRGEGEAVVVMEPDAAVAPGATVEVPATTEHEPNNTTAQAERVYLAPWPLLPGAPVGDNAAAASATPSWAVQGELAAGKDVDTYRLTLVPADGFAADAGVADAGPGEPGGGFASLRIELTPGPTGLANGVVLEGRAPGGARVVQLSTKGEGVMVPNAGLVPGTDLLLSVTRATRKGTDPVPYRLSVVASAPQSGEEVEPNGDPGKATPIASTTATLEAVGYLGWRQDTDWFAVTFPALPPDTAVSVDLQLPGEGVASLAVATDLAAAVTHGYARGATDRLQLRGVGVPVGGTLYVKVQNVGPAVLLQRYRLTLSAVPLAPGYEVEPNDQQATVATATESKLWGFLHPAGDVDSFKVCQRAGMTFSVEGAPRLDLLVSVTDAAGAPLLSFPVSGSKAVQSPPMPAGDCLFIQVRDKSGKGANSLEPYSITFGG
ncbi:MAG: hypothetical protein SF187_15880 [Deltaproteobacteria bacterium]|nr:hypothetical protein [Deltaproteobacteria bacterium]